VFQNKLKEDYLKMSPFAKWIIIENSPEKIIEKIHYFMKHQKEKKEILDIAYSWVKMQTWEKVISIYLQLWK
jgi:spore maturation protein CgeB